MILGRVHCWMAINI